MLSGRRIYLSFVLFAGLFSAGRISFAVQFEPGIGLGLEYTDNARLTPVDQIDDLITASYVGARVIEDGGALQYDAAATYNKHIYLKDTYPDIDYYNLNGGLNWEMVRNRLNWVLTDRYYQRAIVALDSNTPNNLQNANVFTFSANYFHPVSGRQSITLVPMFSQYYYDTTITSNKQLALSADWDYQMSRLMSIGLSFSTRNLDYREQSIEDTRFTDIGFEISGQRRRSTFSMYLGTTIVKREISGEGSGVSGYFNWSQNLTSRSTFETNISSEITDTSRASVSAVDEPGNGNGNDVQLATDVIRYSIINLAYIRDDATLNTRLWARYNSINYSDSPLDRVVHAFGLQSSYPVTQLLSSSIYMNYNHTEQIDTGEINGAYIVGGNLGYSFSRKLRGLLDLKYRKKESTSVSQNYDEFSAFASLVYGFGNILRPTRSGGY